MTKAGVVMEAKRAASAYPIFVAVLVVVLVVMLIALVMAVYDHGLQSVRIALAEEQTAIFDEMRDQARDAPPSRAVGYLEYAVSYYPSGTKQATGSRLDRIVERARGSAVREMIAVLRQKTGQDLGDDPQRWIEEYGVARNRLSPAGRGEPGA
jgi:hypothetical protein